MGVPKWTGERLKDLLELDIDTLAAKYPNDNRETLGRAQRKYKAKFRSTSVEFNAGDKVLKKTWTSSAYDKTEGQWVHTENHSWEHVTAPLEYQAEPAIITPSNHKAPKRNHKVIGVFGDAQIGYRRVLDHTTGIEEIVPTHDERAMNVARKLFAATRPETIVNVGDNIDLGELSRFSPDSDHFYRTLAPSFQRVHDYYAEIRADHPKARIIEVSSNHNERLAKYVLKMAGAFFGLTQANSESKYPVLTYPYLSNFEHLGVEWISGYPAGRFIYGAEYGKAPINFGHGTETSSNASTAAAKAMKNHPDTHVVQGHDHKHSVASHTLRNGEQLQSIIVPALCRTDGVVPSYYNSISDHGTPVHYQENWQQGVTIIRDYMNGNYEFVTVPIHSGVAYFEGKVYEADNGDDL